MVLSKGVRATLAAVLVGSGLGLLPAPAQADTIQATLVKETWTGGPRSNWAHPSPDPSGITYNSRTGKLIISDGEVEETNLSYHVYKGTNLFVADLDGSLAQSGLNTTRYSVEPTGVGFRPPGNSSFPERLFVSDDDQARIFEVNAVDGTYGNADDTSTSSSVAFLDLGARNDAEDVAVDLDLTRDGRLFLVDGKGKRVFLYNPGPDGIFNGTGDFVERTINVGNMGAGDPEGIAYSAGRNTFFVLDDPSNRLYEVSLDGALLNTVTLPFSMKSGAGLAFAPPSGGGSGVNAYIVDRGVDNNTSSTNFNDGRLFEVAIPGLGGGTPPPDNAAPTVSAGPDLGVVLPGAASLDGSVSDDGRPSGGTLSTRWTVSSGAGTVTFGNDADLDTTATFSAAGTYVLRLTASDGEKSSSDETTVTVTDQTNAAPVVSAGPDLTVVLPGVASLDGSASDDGLPNGTLTTTWRKSSGPGDVSFGDASALDTTATFSAAGTYVLALEADDGARDTIDLVTVTVTGSTTPPPPPGGGTLDIKVTASTDDAEQKPSGSMALASGDLNMVQDGSAAMVSGMRFNNVTIPAGATITNASVQFQADETQSVATNLVIRAQVGNGATFTTASKNITSRPLTAESVAWNDIAAWTAPQRSAAQKSPDISTVVQAALRSNWATGDSLVLVITGSGERTAESFDGGAAKAPVLHVEFTTP